MGFNYCRFLNGFDNSFYYGKGNKKLIAVELAPPPDCNYEKIMDSANLLKESNVESTLTNIIDSSKNAISHFSSSAHSDKSNEYSDLSFCATDFSKSVNTIAFALYSFASLRIVSRTTARFTMLL